MPELREARRIIVKGRDRTSLALRSLSLTGYLLIFIVSPSLLWPRRWFSSSRSQIVKVQRRVEQQEERALRLVWSQAL